MLKLSSFFVVVFGLLELKMYSFLYLFLFISIWRGLCVRHRMVFMQFSDYHYSQFDFHSW